MSVLGSAIFAQFNTYIRHTFFSLQNARISLRLVLHQNPSKMQGKQNAMKKRKEKYRAEGAEKIDRGFENINVF